MIISSIIKYVEKGKYNVSIANYFKFWTDLAISGIFYKILTLQNGNCIPKYIFYRNSHICAPGWRGQKMWSGLFVSKKKKTTWMLINVTVFNIS